MKQIPYMPIPRLVSDFRYLPDPVLIPLCPNCGDHERVQLVVVGMPASPPGKGEEGRVVFAGCMVDEATPDGSWWCPTCELAYPWTYPFERTLLVREPWVSMLLDGYKTWELRRSSTKVRGRVGLTPSGSGEIAGSAKLWDVHGPFTAEELGAHRELHRVDDEFLDDYAAGKTLYAWEFRDAEWFEPPAPYEHPQGAVIWVKLPRSSAEGL